MIEDIALRAFDEIVNPVMLCETNGKVIYKNKEAKKSIPKPILGGKLQTYLSRDYKFLIECGGKKEYFPTFVDFQAEGDQFSAFIDLVYYERRPVLMLVFSHMFLYRISSPLLAAPPHKLRSEISGEKLAKIATEVYTSDLVVEASRNLSYHKRMTQIFYKLIDTLLTEVAYTTDQIIYPLAYSIRIIVYACHKVLTHLGLDILFDIRYEDADTTFVDLKSMILIVANYILLAAEISDSHLIHATVYEGEWADAVFRFPIKLKRLPALMQEGCIESFSELLPGRSIDLFFFDYICKNSDYFFDYALNPQEEHNLSMQLYVPISRQVILRDTDVFCFEDAIRMIDKLTDQFLVELANEEPLFE